MPSPLVECVNVSKSFAVKRGPLRYDVRAVEDVSLSIAPGQTLGLVGESGSGKTTLGRIVSALMPPTSGDVLLGGVPVGEIARRRQRELRRRLQIVWQDPLASMNVRDTIEMIVTEAPIAHGLLHRNRRRARAEEILASVGLPTDIVLKRPTQLSGGQLQRIAIGRALSLAPELVVCDEVTSALDVSVQAQILNLLHEVQQRTQVAYLFISHDLHVVKHISDVVAVMYAGRIVEFGAAKDLYRAPRHPYTRELVRIAHAELTANSSAADLPLPTGATAVGCAYRESCPLRESICDEVQPPLVPATPGGLVACHVATRQTAALPIP